MQVVENTPDRLVLRGVPGGRNAMGVFAVLGAVFVAVFGVMMVREYLAGDWTAALFMLFGVIIGMIALAAGADSLMTRESVTLDHQAREGWYTRRHLIAARRRDEQQEFAYDDLAAVVVERREVHTHDSDQGSRTSVHWRALVRIDNPRRSILLAESQNDHEMPVRAVAAGVAEALGMPIIEDLAEDREIEDVTTAREFTVSLLARDRGTPIELPAPPEGARAKLDIDPERVEIRLTWPVMNGIAVLIPFLAFFILWTVLSIVILLGAVGALGAGAAPAGTMRWVAGLACGSFVAIGIAVLIPLVRLAMGARRVVIVSAAGVRVRNPAWFDLRTVPTESITTVRVAPGDDDAVLLYHGDAKARIGIHNPAKGEVAWIAATIREAVRAMRPRHEHLESK